MSGIADLVAAFAGGDRLENEAYYRHGKRILDAQNSQAMLDKRVQEAYDAARQSSQKEAFGNILAQLGPEMESQNYQLTPIQITNLMRYGTGGGISDIEGVIKGLQEQFMAQRLLSGRLDEGMTDPNAVTNAYFKHELVPTLQKEGDLMIRGNYTANPEVDPVATAMNAIAGAQSDPSGTKGVREQKIEDAMRLYNFDRPTAVAFVDGYVDQTINENTGKVVRTNILPEGAVTIPGYGAAVEIPITGGTSGTPTPQPQPGQTLFNLAEVGTGFGPVTTDLISRGLSLFGVASDMEPTRAIQTINTAKNEMIRALSINPRFPIGEIERLQKEINIAPGFFTSTDTMRARMESIDKSLRLRLAQAERDSNDPTLSEEVRQSQGDNAVMIRNFIAQLGVPQSIQIPPELRAQIANELIALPGWEDLTPEEREELIQYSAEDRMQQ